MQATVRNPRGLLALAWVLFTSALAGCLGEPEIEDRWTRLDIVEVETGVVDPGTHLPSLRLRGRITYRNILTGSLVMEIRASAALGAKDLDLREEADRFVATQQIATLLESSDANGSATLGVTGFDRLIQEVDFFFPGDLPAPPPGGAVFAVFYFADVSEMENPEGEEVTVITARDFEAEQILPGAYLLAEGDEEGTP